MCWHERVTGSRVRQLQPRLLKQRFSVRRFSISSGDFAADSFSNLFVLFFSFTFSSLDFSEDARGRDSLRRCTSRRIVFTIFARFSSIFLSFEIEIRKIGGSKFSPKLGERVASGEIRDARGERRPTAFYISHPPRITVKITGRGHAFRGGYVDRYDPQRELPFSLAQT